LFKTFKKRNKINLSARMILLAYGKHYFTHTYMWETLAWPPHF